MLMSIQKTITSEEGMEELGKELAQKCFMLSPESFIIYLKGQLGAGKTTLVRGFLRAMDYQGVVKSPTYTLVETYDFSPKINHFDFYRIRAPEELEYIGVREYFSDSYCLVEWPEKAQGMLPLDDLTVNILIEGLTRQVILQANTERGKHVLQTL